MPREDATMVWDKAHITPKDWRGVIEFYVELEERNKDFGAMRKLAAHIAAQPYAPSLAGATSGTALFIAAPSPADWANDALRIDVTLASTVRFTSPPKGRLKPNVFESDGDRVTPMLERLLRQLRWLAP